MSEVPLRGHLRETLITANTAAMYAPPHDTEAVSFRSLRFFELPIGGHRNCFLQKSHASFRNEQDLDSGRTQDSSVFG